LLPQPGRIEDEEEDRGSFDGRVGLLNAFDLPYASIVAYQFVWFYYI